MTTENKKTKQTGRKPKIDPCRHRLAINLNDEDYAKFVSIYAESGLSNKANFIVSCIFNRPLKVIKIDKAAMDYYMRLTTFYSQFRAVGVNYNQVVKAIKTTFTEKKALAFLYKLEQATREMIEINTKIIDLTAEFEQKYQVW